MKKALLPAICILLCTLCIIFVPTDAEAAIYEDTLRLHILAPSDSVEDQSLKLKIRDRILNKYGHVLNSASDLDEAEGEIRSAVKSIEEDCNEWISELGYTYTASAEITEEWYGTREYSHFTLPSGSYSSLKITIGEGKGQNWWCVMYPPMCLEASVNAEGAYTKEEKNLISGDKYRIKFKLLEATSELFKRRK